MANALLCLKLSLIESIYMLRIVTFLFGLSPPQQQTFSFPFLFRSNTFDL